MDDQDKKDEHAGAQDERKDDPVEQDENTIGNPSDDPDNLDGLKGDDKHQVPPEIRDHRAGTKGQLKAATRCPSLNISREAIAYDVETIWSFFDKQNTSVAIIFGAAYVEEVSIGVVQKLESFRDLAAGTEDFHYRDISTDDVIVHSPADVILKLLEEEVNHQNIVRLNLDLSVRSDLCEVLLQEVFLDRLESLFSERKARLLICIDQQRTSISSSVQQALDSCLHRHIVRWPEILLGVWSDRLDLADDIRELLLGNIKHELDRVSGRADRAARAADILTSSSKLDSIDEADEQGQNDCLKTLVEEAFAGSETSDSKYFRDMVESGWQKPLNQLLLALYICLSRKSTVLYRELRHFGILLLREEKVAYPFPLQQTRESSGQAGENTEVSVKTVHQFDQVDAVELWCDHIDDLFESCNLAIDQKNDKGLVVKIRGMSDEWLAREYCRRYPGWLIRIRETIVEKRMLFPLELADETSSNYSVSDSFITARLLICLHSLDSIEFPNCLESLLITGSDLIDVHKTTLRPVSIGIAAYLIELRNNTASFDQYKEILEEVCSIATKNHKIAIILVNAFGWIADQEKYATLEYLFKLLSRPSQVSEALWSSMRRVFVVHMKESLADRINVLEQMGKLVKEQDASINIRHLMYSRLCFDAIRSDFGASRREDGDLFSAVVESQDKNQINKILAIFERADPNLVLFGNVSIEWALDDTVDTLLNGINVDYGDASDNVIVEFRESLTKVLKNQHQDQIKNKQKILFEKVLSSKSPNTRLNQYKLYTQTNAAISLGETALSMYQRFFALALLEWGSDAAGIGLEKTSEEALDIINTYLVLVNSNFDDKDKEMYIRYWNEAALFLEQSERKLNPPEDVHPDIVLVYEELKNLIRKKMSRYYGMAEHLNKLSRKTELRV